MFAYMAVIGMPVSLERVACGRKMFCGKAAGKAPYPPCKKGSDGLADQRLLWWRIGGFGWKDRP